MCNVRPEPVLANDRFLPYEIKAEKKTALLFLAARTGWRGRLVKRDAAVLRRDDPGRAVALAVEDSIVAVIETGHSPVDRVVDRQHACACENLFSILWLLREGLGNTLYLILYLFRERVVFHICIV
jgi:hypothetical protein